MRPEIKQILDFLHQSEKLKTVMRHSWLSNDRQESVAEHTWRMALMAMMLEPYLEQKVDLLKTMKMVLVHDLVEVNYQDNPPFKKPPPDKTIQERKSLVKLTKPLPPKLCNELRSLWEEYEAANSQEALFAKFLDKTEVLLQHNEANIIYLTKAEIPFNLTYGKEYSKHDNFLADFRQAIDNETLVNYKKHKVSKKLYTEF